MFDQTVARWTSPGSPFELRESNVLGWRTKVFAHGPQSLLGWIEGSKGFGDKPFLTNQNSSLTFAGAFSRALELSTNLTTRLPVRPEDRIALLIEQGPLWFIAFLAVVLSGATPVLVGRREKSELLATQLTAADASWVLCDKDTTTNQRADFHCVCGLFAIDDGSLSASRIANCYPRLEGGGAKDGAQHDAMILMTSGTTGSPKPLLISDLNVITGLQNMILAGLISRLGRVSGGTMARRSERATVMPLTPLSHVSGCSQLLLMWRLGGHVVLPPEGDADEISACIQKHNVTALTSLSPTKMREMVNLPEALSRLSSVRAVHYSGGHLPEDVRQAWTTRLPMAVLTPGYGLSETFGTICAEVTADNAGGPLVTGGRVLPTVEVCIDRTNAAVGDRFGEICVRGAMVATHYSDGGIRQPLLTNGWLKTGDLGEIMPDGRLHIVDRCDNAIRIGNVQHPAAVLEAVVAEALKTEVAVIGLPSNGATERIGIASTVNMDPPRSNLLKEALARAGIPHNIEYCVFVCEELPRTRSGKTNRRAVREAFSTEMKGVGM